MNPENLLKSLDSLSYCNIIAGMVIVLCLFILAPFIRQSFKGKKSA